MIFQSCIDQGCPHVMDCQIEPLIIQDKIQDITFLISRSFLLDQLVYVIQEPDEILDCAAWEIDNRPITFYIFLKYCCEDKGVDVELGIEIIDDVN